MQEYDVIIIGAGPAGCQCARTLSKAGKHVLIAEKAKSFDVNNYSSGGAPLEIMQHFSLPQDTVGTYWNKLSIHTSKVQHTWSSNTPKGVILDFKKLRSYLIDEASKYSCKVCLDTTYIKHEIRGNKTQVHLKNNETNEVQTLLASILVDATGVERKVLKGNHPSPKKIMEATGIEYLIEVPSDIYEQYSNTLSFFLGHKWMPQGYAWIFPMQPNQLKVGVIRYFPHQQWVPQTGSYKHYLDHLIHTCLHTDTPHVLDRHGKTLTYHYQQKDLFFDRNVIAIGDAISTLNPLACEGIRHAMSCADIASQHILNDFNAASLNFKSYQKDIRSAYGIKWQICEWLMDSFYKESDDDKIDLFLKTLQGLSYDELLDVGFNYKATTAFKFFLRNAGLKMRHSLRL